jgi:hypothetical protein
MIIFFVSLFRFVRYVSLLQDRFSLQYNFHTGLICQISVLFSVISVQIPTGRWHCNGCAVCISCGTTEPFKAGEVSMKDEDCDRDNGNDNDNDNENDNNNDNDNNNENKENDCAFRLVRV